MSGEYVYELLDEGGTPLARFVAEDAAVEALHELVEADPWSRFDTFVAVFDAVGKRVNTIYPDPPRRQVGIAAVEVVGSVTPHSLELALARGATSA